MTEQSRDRPEDVPESRPDDSVASETPLESPEEHAEEGLDLARSVARGLAGRTGRKRKRSALPRPPRSSSAHPDDRDPQPIDAALGWFVADQGWTTELRVHGVFTRWPAIVGAEVAAHATPEAFADGRLTVRTDSTAWATELRLLAATVVRRLNEELGDGTVESIDVVGPRGPRWTSGRLRVKGRGPRDTYG